MNNNIFYGDLVRLAALDPEEIATIISRHSRDSEYMRLMESSPCFPYTKENTKKWIEKQLENQKVFAFAIRALADDRLLGDVGLGNVNWSHGNGYIGIGIGERDFWGKGYGSDAMRLALRYAFTELNLRRVTLGVYEYNPRAVRCYEKVGFQHEGRIRQYMNRAGRRWDEICMGILKEEWFASNTNHQNL
jgi:RimJ/RimL family protein N-acetyltransferase